MFFDPSKCNTTIEMEQALLMISRMVLLWYIAASKLLAYNGTGDNPFHYPEFIPVQRTYSDAY